MTESFGEEPTTPLELRLTEELALARAALADQQNQYEAQLSVLRERLVALEELEQITAERNNLRTQVADVTQELDRLRGVLQDTVAGVTTWAPDLTPIDASTVPEELREAYVRDQVAARRRDWDTFVQRVVSQANA